MKINELLRSIRGEDSLRDAKKKTGLSHNYISILEKGYDPRTGSPMRPSPDSLKAYAEGYNFPYTKLLIAAGYITYDQMQEALLENTDSILKQYLKQKDSIDNIFNDMKSTDPK